MKSRDIVGRRIVAVEQTRFYNSHTQTTDVQLDWLELDNGARVIFVPNETETGAYVTGDVVKPRRGDQ